MSVAVKTRLIEIMIRDGARKKLFLVPHTKAEAIEVLIQEAPAGNEENELISIGDIFPEIKDPEKRRFIVFRSIRTKTGLTQAQLDTAKLFFVLFRKGSCLDLDSSSF